MSKAIMTKYHRCTATKGSRMSAYDGDFRVYMQYDPELPADGNHRAVMLKLVNTYWESTRDPLFGQYTIDNFVEGFTKQGNVYLRISRPERKQTAADIIRNTLITLTKEEAEKTVHEFNEVKGMTYGIRI